MILSINLTRIVFVIVVSFTIVSKAVSQSAPSAFDLLPRITGFTANDTSIAATIANNPFDIVKNPGAGRRSATGTGFTVEKSTAPPTERQKTVIFKRFVFISVMVMMVILTLCVTIFRLLLQRIWQVFLNDNLLGQLIREKGEGLFWAYRILYVMFFLNAGFFLFLTIKNFGGNIHDNNFKSLGICIGGVAAYFILKHFLLSFLGFIFPVEREATVYAFTMQIFNIVSGFILVPAIVFVAYAPADIARLSIYITLVVLGLVFLFLMFRGLFIANRFLAWNKFHFFLYLCAVEILPVLILVKEFLLVK